MRLLLIALVMMIATGGAAAARVAILPPHHVASHRTYAVARHDTHPTRIAARAARPHLGGSLVRCTLLRQPRPDRQLASGRRQAHYFAPTSQAVFFAHAGDRCVWHAGAAVHG